MPRGGILLRDLPLNRWQQLHPGFEQDIYEAIAPRQVVAARLSEGMVAQVEKQLQAGALSWLDVIQLTSVVGVAGLDFQCFPFAGILPPVSAVQSVPTASEHFCRQPPFRAEQEDIIGCSPLLEGDELLASFGA